jgi:hypothetical protein
MRTLTDRTFQFQYSAWPQLFFGKGDSIALP